MTQGSLEPRHRWLCAHNFVQVCVCSQALGGAHMYVYEMVYTGMLVYLCGVCSGVYTSAPMGRRACVCRVVLVCVGYTHLLCVWVCVLACVLICDVCAYLFLYI